VAKIRDHQEFESLKSYLKEAYVVSLASSPKPT